MNVPSSNSIVTIWFIFEYIYYRFVTIARLDCLLTPQRQRGSRGGGGGEAEEEEKEEEEEAFHTGSRCVSSFGNKY